MAENSDNSSERLHDLPDAARALSERAQEVLHSVCEADLSVATAESCTGGLLASLMTDLPGLSHAFERGFVTYSEDAKVELLGIDDVQARAILDMQLRQLAALERQRIIDQHDELAAQIEDLTDILARPERQRWPSRGQRARNRRPTPKAHN